MIDPGLNCQEGTPARDVRSSERLLGLDYVEVSDDQLTLNVVFLGKAPRAHREGRTSASRAGGASATFK